MEINFKVKLNIDSWFEYEREPKTYEAWKEFLLNHFVPQANIIGETEEEDGEEFEDLVSINSVIIEIEKIKA